MRLNVSTLWCCVKLGALLLVLPLTFAPPAHAAERAIDKEIIVPVGLDAAWAAWTTRDGIISFSRQTPSLMRALAAHSTFISTRLPSPA